MTARRLNGQSPADAFLTLPGFQLTQRLALEAARFSAQRMRAYADQFEALAKCADAGEVVAAQQRFFTQLTEDYAAESAAMREIIAAEAPKAPSRQSGQG
jgi:hypothetical protein